MAEKPIIRKFKRCLRQEAFADLQWNPYSAAQLATGESMSHPDAQEAFRKFQNNKNESLIAYSDIFGDTRKGMLLGDAIDILESEGFIASDDCFIHDYLGVKVLLGGMGQGLLGSIELLLDLPVITENFESRNFGGLGIMEGDLIENRFVGRIDATGGLRLKMMFVRQIASASDVESNTL